MRPAPTAMTLPASSARRLAAPNTGFPRFSLAPSNVYVCGNIASTDWGVSGGWDTSLDGPLDRYFVKLSSEGGRLWSTCFGGSKSRQGCHFGRLGQRLRL